MHTLDDPWGTVWAGLITIEKSYDWEPLDVVKGIKETKVLGMEAPIWTEGVPTKEALDYLTFPRILSYSEIAWSKRSNRNWDNFKQRLSQHGARLDYSGISFNKSNELEWLTR